MKVEILSFGKIAGVISSQHLDISGIMDTDAFKVFLENRFSEMSTMKYMLAINNNIVQRNSPISDNDVIAIMPPFSGG